MKAAQADVAAAELTLDRTIIKPFDERVQRARRCRAVCWKRHAAHLIYALEALELRAFVGRSACPVTRAVTDFLGRFSRIQFLCFGQNWWSSMAISCISSDLGLS